MRTKSAEKDEKDPMAMDVDAIRTGTGSTGNTSRGSEEGKKTWDDFKKVMQGKCYSCSRAGHVKADCRFKNATCRACDKRGHVESACTAKFLGQKKREARVAGIEEEAQKEKKEKKEEKNSLERQIEEMLKAQEEMRATIAALTMKVTDF